MTNTWNTGLDISQVCTWLPQNHVSSWSACKKLCPNPLTWQWICQGLELDETVNLHNTTYRSPVRASFGVSPVQYIPRNMHTVFALLCFVVVIHWLIFPYPSGLLHWHCGNLTIAPVPAKQPWWIWMNTSCEFIMNNCITTTKQSTTKPCAYLLGYTVSTLKK